MVTESAERKAAKSAPPPPQEPEHLPCPRCDSTNTKFCYYNNYNFSQPRHFCKSCRRYWTHGGTLRDIPIGGGSRKNAKRSRTTTASASAAFALPRHDFRNFPAAASQLLIPFGGDHGGSFTSLLNTQGTGVWALGGFGPGLDEMGFGLGKTVWPFQGVVEGGPGPTNGNVGPMHTWQVESGGESGVDCFGFPDLAISTPGGSFIMK